MKKAKARKRVQPVSIADIHKITMDASDRMDRALAELKGQVNMFIAAKDRMIVEAIGDTSKMVHDLADIHNAIERADHLGLSILGLSMMKDVPLKAESIRPPVQKGSWLSRIRHQMGLEV